MIQRQKKNTKGEKLEHTARPADIVCQLSFPGGLTGMRLFKSGWFVSVPFRLLGYFDFCLGLVRVGRKVLENLVRIKDFLNYF